MFYLYLRQTLKISSSPNYLNKCQISQSEIGFGDTLYVEHKEDMKTLDAAIRAIPDETCRTILIGQIEGRSLDEIFAQIKLLEPSLNRDQFDLRVIACRHKLWKRLKEHL